MSTGDGAARMKSFRDTTVFRRMADHKWIHLLKLRCLATPLAHPLAPFCSRLSRYMYQMHCICTSEVCACGRHTESFSGMLARAFVGELSEGVDLSASAQIRARPAEQSGGIPPADGLPPARLP